jgi:toxin YoeB
LNRKLEVIWSPESLKQIQRIKKWKNKIDSENYLNAIIELIKEIKKEPFKGLGKPEHLKYKIPPCWSRRINLKDRLIYRVRKNEIEIISILGHYE